MKLVFDLGKVLLKTGSFRIGTFPTHDGKVSPYYIDLGHVFYDPEAFGLVEACLEKTVSELLDVEGFAGFCGVPQTGLLLCTPLALKFRKQLIYKTRGPETRIVGVVRPGSNILIVDGVSETGKSIGQAVKAIRESGGIVKYAVTLIDRLEIAKQELSRLEVDLRSFTTIREMSSILNDRMALSEEQEKLIDAKPEKI